MKHASRINSLALGTLAGAMLTLLNPAFGQTAEGSLGTRPARTRGAVAPVSESVRAGTVTAPNGQVAITSIDRKWDEKSGTGTINEAAVTPDGKISTREGNLTRSPNGDITTRGTFTDFDGRSADYTETTKRTATGPVVVGKMIDEEGKVASYETTASNAGRGQTKLTTIITHADGLKETRVEILAPARTTRSS